MISVLLALGCWFLFRHLWRGDPRRLRPAVVLLLGAWIAWGALLEVIGYFAPDLLSLLGVLLLVLPLSVLVLAGFLVRNGFQMLRREGRSLKNLLPLVAGIALIALPAAALLLAATRHPVGLGAAVLALYASAQIGLSFLAFLVFSVAYARHRPRPGADAVVVLGSGLVDGEVTPLLASRLDRGREEWERQGRLPPLIPSGGQGPDEPRAEAAGMAEYLVEHGVPESAILPEARSRTTEENLRFARTIAGGTLPEGARRGHLLVATSEYHAPRAALLSRRLGIDADVVGGPSAGYYVPSAYLREFLAVLVMNARTQLLLAVPGLLLSIGLTAALVLRQPGAAG
jgi:uncharacterized SAM-binding protein YcdF (DUF218 family)